MNRSFITHLIGIAIFLFLLTRINISDTFSILINANPIYFVIAVILIIPMLLLEAFRWHFILRQLGINYPFGESFSMFASSLFIGSVTPARLGEFVRVGFLKGHSLGKSFFSVFIDRISDIAFLLGAGYIGMFFFAVALGQQLFWLSIAIVGFIVLSTIMIVRQDIVKMVLRIVFSRIVPEKFKPELKVAFYDFYRSLFTLLNFKSVSVVLFLTLLSWLVYYFMVFSLSRSLGIEISFIYLATSVSIAGLLSIIPISISGIGTRDAALVFFFGLIGIRSEFAIALSALILVMMALSAAVCFPFWLRKPANLSFFSER